MRSQLSVVLACLTLLLSVEAQCRERTLTGGWSPVPPYSFVTNVHGIPRWEGFDVELTAAIADRANTIIVSDRISWEDHVAGIRSGEIDVAPRAALTAERQEFAIFSIPYRSETMVLVLRTDSQVLAASANVGSLVQTFKDRKFRMGFEPGVELPSIPLRNFIENPGYSNAIFKMSAIDLIAALLNNEIDGFWADRIEVAYFTDTFGVSDLVKTHPVQVHGNLHFMFNKETVPWDVVHRFNSAIESVHVDGTYQRLNAKYSFPILVSLSLDNFWFKAVDVIGTIAFALSGLLLAYRHKYDLFGALVLASLPAVGGGVLRDLISGRGEVVVFSDPLYISLILILVGGGYLIVKMVRHLPSSVTRRLGSNRPERNRQVLGWTIEFCDAVGLAAFTVTGVVVALITNSTPLWIWGPILAAITAAGGGILRDITRSDPNIPFLKGEFYPEVAVMWGLILSIFLLWEARLMEPDHITLGIVVTFFGALITRLLVLRFDLSSPVFFGRIG